MKKTILALTIPALFATSASAVEIYSAEDGSKVDLYGRLEYNAGGLDYQAGSDERENFGGDGLARVGINFNQVLNQDVSLIGKYEANFDAEGDQDDVDTRYAWLGFNFQGTTDVKFGKSDTSWTQLSDLTDTFDIFGASAVLGSSKISDINDDLSSNVKVGPTSRAEDQIAVSYAANGLDLRAAYSFDDANKNDTNPIGQKSRYGVSAGYTLPVGLGFVAAYEVQKDVGFVDTSVPEAYKGDVDTWGAGAHYSIDGFYFAGLYGNKTYDIDNEGEIGTKFWELLASYSVDAWTLQAAYAKEDGRKAISGEDITDAYTLGARYSFTPKTKVYAEYVINEIDGMDDLYGVGIQYNF
ncbi:MAG: porin [Oceanisphaera sp.]